MKILQLSPQNIFPPTDGGKIGIFNEFKFLNQSLDTKIFETHIVIFYNDKNINTWKKYENIGKIYPVKHSTVNTKSKIIKSFLSNKSLYLTKHFDNSILSELENLINENQYDAILCDHTAMAEYGIKLKEKLNIPIFLRLYNIEYLIWERYYQNLSLFNPLRIFIKQQAQLLKKYELNVINKFDKVFTINENETIFLRKIGNYQNILTILPGVDTNIWNINKGTQNSKKKKYSIAIATTFDWIHNVDGIDWFIDNVLPKIRKKLPETKLYLYGKNIPQKFKNIENKGVHSLGFVDDIISELTSNEIYIAPLFVGAGIRIKILEAMSLGLPVIATKVSADGINSALTNGLFITDDPTEQANIIINLFENETKLKELSNNNVKFINDNYNLKNNVDIIKNALMNN